MAKRDGERIHYRTSEHYARMAAEKARRYGLPSANAYARAALIREVEQSDLREAVDQFERLRREAISEVRSLRDEVRALRGELAELRLDFNRAVRRSPSTRGAG